MRKALWANVKNNLVYYRRNRLLLVVGLLCVGVLLVSSFASIFWTTANNRFELARGLYTRVSMYTMLMVGLIGLIAVWSHRANKSVKLIFTRPCSPRVWLASHYVSAGLVFLLGMTIAVGSYLVSSLVWGIPIQTAVFASALNHFIETFLVFSYLMLLSNWMHPVAAVLFFVFISENTFYYLALLCRAGSEALPWKNAPPILPGLETAFQGLYYLLPTMAPFETELQQLSTSLRMPDNCAIHLLKGLVYLALFIFFSFSLTVYNVRRQCMN